MNTRKLRNHGLEVSEAGFGCMGLNFSYSHSITKEESVKSHQKPISFKLQEKGIQKQLKKQQGYNS